MKKQKETLKDFLRVLHNLEESILNKETGELNETVDLGYMYGHVLELFEIRTELEDCSLKFEDHWWKAEQAIEDCCLPLSDLSHIVLRIAVNSDGTKVIHLNA